MRKILLLLLFVLSIVSCGDAEVNGVVTGMKHIEKHVVERYSPVIHQFYTAEYPEQFFVEIDKERWINVTGTDYGKMAVGDTVRLHRIPK